jgi:hypothetical protein
MDKANLRHQTHLGFSVCLNISSYNLGNTSRYCFSERVELMRRIPIKLLVSTCKNPEFLMLLADGTFLQQQRSSQ